MVGRGSIARVSELPTSLTPLTGGWSGQTFLGEVDGERVVVRIYPPDDPRGVTAPEVDAAVMRLVRGLVPVPDVVEVRRGDPDGAPGLLLTRWLPAMPGDRALGELPEAGRVRMGAAMGRTAATLAGMPTVRAGTFRDADLRPEPFTPAVDLVEWVEQHEPALPGWDAAERAGLRDVADRAQDLLEAVDRTCLVHSDLNPKNVQVDRGGNGGDVVAVLDWEFAHSGHPYTDLGNVLRLDREPGYADAALAAYVGLRGGTPEQALDLARAADLWALVDLAARDVRNPVADRAEVLLRAVATGGDLHAWPAGW